VLQRCTHSRFQLCEIVNIHAAQSVMTCVSPASLQRFRDIAHRVSGVNKSRFTRVKCGAGEIWPHVYRNGNEGCHSEMEAVLFGELVT
jgi:hypothetical protein